MRLVYILTDEKRYSPNRIGGGESYIRRLLHVSEYCDIKFNIILISSSDTYLEQTKHKNHLTFGNANEAIKYVKNGNFPVILFNLGWRTKLKFIFYQNVYLLNLFYPKNWYVYSGRRIELILMNYRGIFVPSIKLKKMFEKVVNNVLYLPPIVTEHFVPKGKHRPEKFGFIGRLDLRKGILQVLSALKKGIIDDVKISYIKHQYDPGVLLLEKELLRIGGNFREVNQQSYSIKVESELIDELNEIQIFLQSYESLDSTVDMPLLILEALACGCSVVTNIEFEELNHPQLLIDFNGIKHSNLASNKIQSGVLRSKSSKAIHDKFNILAARDRIMEFFDEKNIS